MEYNHKPEGTNYFSNSMKPSDNLEVMNFSPEGVDANRDATVLTSISDNHRSLTLHHGQETLNNNHKDMKVSGNGAKTDTDLECMASDLNNKHPPTEVQISSFESGNENPKVVTDDVNWHSMKEISFNPEITGGSTKPLSAASQISGTFQSSGEDMNMNIEPDEENLIIFNNHSEAVTSTSDITNDSHVILSHVPEIIIHSPRTMHEMFEPAQDSLMNINWNMNDVNYIPEAMNYSLETQEQGEAVNDILELSTDITNHNRSEPPPSNHEGSTTSSSSSYHVAANHNPDDTLHDITRHSPEAVSSIRFTNRGVDINNQVREDHKNNQEADEGSHDNFEPNKDSEGTNTDNHAINFLAHNSFNRSHETLHGSETVKHIFDFLVNPSLDIVHQSDHTKAAIDNTTHEDHTYEDLRQKPATKIEILCLDSLNNSYNLAANTECPESMISNRSDTDQKPPDLKQNPTSDLIRCCTIQTFI